MQYQVLARKWRPRRFTEMVGQEHVLRALTNALDSGRIHHAFLFTGTRGVGKTTLARILAKSLNCETGITSSPCGECATCRAIDEGRYVDLIEVDAASRTKVEDTRELLDNVQYAPTRGRFKVYLIDEVHMLSNHSFNALLKTLEEPPPHIKFLFATTDPQKMPVTILSRCLQFNLKRLYPDLIVGHLKHILGQEQTEFEDTALKHLAKAADGSMRDALSLLDQAIAYGAGRVSSADVRAMLGSIEQIYLYDLLSALATRNAQAMMQVLVTLKERALDYADVLTELLTLLHHLALLQQLPDAYDESMGDKHVLQQLAQQLVAEDIQLFYQIGLIGKRDMSYAPNPYLGFEMILLRMFAFKMDATPDAIQEKKPNEPAAAKPITSNTSKPLTSAPAAVTKPVTMTTPNPVPKMEPVPEVSGDTAWLEIILKMSLVGMVKEMAMHSILKSYDDSTVQVTLDVACKNLLSEERRSQLQAALQNYFSKPVRLTVEIGQVANATPASILQRQQQARQQQAQDAIKSDENVKRLMDTFGAQLKSDSVQPVD